MSIRFDAAADYLSRSTGLLDYNNPYTMMGWFYATTIPDISYCMHLGKWTTVRDQDECSFWFDTKTALEVWITDGFTQLQGTLNSAATWYHFAMVRESATVLKLYRNGVLDLTNTRDITGRTALDKMNVGALMRGAVNDGPLNGRASGLKAWSTALTISEVVAEMNYARPIRTTSLWGVWPLRSATDVYDHSGNDRDWTPNGALTTEDDPPDVDFSTDVLTALGDNLDTTYARSSVNPVAETMQLATPVAGTPGPGPWSISIRQRKVSR